MELRDLPLLLVLAAAWAGCADESVAVGEHVHVLTIFAVGIIALTVLIHMFTDFLDMVVRGKHYYEHLLKAVYKEMSNVGLTAFIIFAMHLANGSDGVASWIQDTMGPSPGQQLILFEILHMGLFVSLILYIVVTVFLMLGTYSFKCRFITLEEEYTEEHTRLYREQLGTVRWFHIIPRERYTLFRAARRFHNFNVIRSSFIRQHRLPNSFAFSEYLNQHMDELVVRLCHIHWTTWMVVLLIVLINWIRYVVVGGIELRSTDSVTPSYFIFLPAGYIILLSFVVVWWKVSTIHKTVLDRDISELKRQRPKRERGHTFVGMGRGDPVVVAPIGGNMRGSDKTSTRGAIEAEVGKAGFCCARRRDTVYASMFWFGKPSFLERLTQFLLLFITWYLGFCIYLVITEWPPFTVPVFLVPVLLVWIYLVPHIIPGLTIVSHVGNPELDSKNPILAGMIEAIELNEILAKGRESAALSHLEPDSAKGALVPVPQEQAGTPVHGLSSANTSSYEASSDNLSKSEESPDHASTSLPPL